MLIGGVDAFGMGTVAACVGFDASSSFDALAASSEGFFVALGKVSVSVTRLYRCSLCQGAPEFFVTTMKKEDELNRRRRNLHGKILLGS